MVFETWRAGRLRGAFGILRSLALLAFLESLLFEVRAHDPFFSVGVVVLSQVHFGRLDSSATRHAGGSMMALRYE